MKERLEKLFNECIQELKNIGIDFLDEQKIGKIDISIARRNNKRYGCCKQEEPDKAFKTVVGRGWRRTVKYEKFNVHHIEISKWVLELDDIIIKNTIIHELIHCIPFCNNHGLKFKQYANYINQKLGYNISRLGNKKEDYEKSNVEYAEEKQYKYKIQCTKCGQEYLRLRLNKNFTRKYRCGKCRGKLEIVEKL